MFHWLHDHQRREMLAQPFPAEWLDFLRANVIYYARLAEAEQAKLRDDLRILVNEKNWEGCGGLPMAPEIQVTIAAQASLLLVGWPDTEYKTVGSILVYPSGYVAREPDRLWNSWNTVVTEAPSARMGQASSSGTVILSWGEALTDGRQPDRGQNVVLHEFAHILDARDGDFDGVPRLPDAMLGEWSQVMTQEFQALVAATQQGRATLLDPYGATDAAEFFAVLTECFFGKPLALREHHPRLYTLLRHYYHQDTAARAPAAPP